MNKKEKNKQLKNKNGITLIALVVTIIVLIILAGVSISLVLGENGIITKARDAARKTEEARLNEEVATNELMEQWEGLVGSSNPTTPEESIIYTIGQEVTIREEQFYVLEDSFENKETVKLLAKYNLNKEATAQQPNANYGDTSCPFSSSNYWAEEDLNITPKLNLNEYEAVTTETESAVSKAKKYATTVVGKTAKGRLLTYEEAIALKQIAITADETGKIAEMLWGQANTQNIGNYLMYWLGSTDTAGGVCSVIGGGLSSYGATLGQLCGVRPVIEVSKTGSSNIIKPITPPRIVSEIEKYRDSGVYMTSKTTLKDSNDNLIVVPEGFKIAKDSGINVTEGIVIEDNDIIEGVGNDRGNQYVWIPVGEGIKKSDGTTVDITLGRYLFADGENHKDNKGTVFEEGTPILKQSAENYEEETGIHIKEIYPTTTLDYEYKELKINREGIKSEGGSNSLNATALDLKGFIDSVQTNGGYYIARYEASYGKDDRKANSKVSIGTPAESKGTTKTEGMLWNFISQIDATIVSRDLYKVGEKVTINSDLINSYAWDTAIVYIQEFSGDTDYSRKTAKSGTLANTGVNGDEVCKINDMASNTREWTTEYSSYRNSSVTYPSTNRAGCCDDNNNTYTGERFSTATGYAFRDGTFRTILYI